MGHNGFDGSQASGPWAIGSGYRFTTSLATFVRLGPLPHGDMVFPIWAKKAITAEFGPTSPQSRSYICMTMVSNNTSKISIDTEKPGTKIHAVPALEVASSYYSP